MVDLDNSMQLSQDTLPFSYDQMKSWYDQLRIRRLQPALESTKRYLTEIIEENLSEFDRRRIQLGSSRIKSPARLWEKLNQPAYLSKIDSLESVPDVIDDLVGLRIICNNTSDIGVVQTMLSALPDLEEEATPAIALEPTKERLYHEQPKPSGYRAYHVNLSVHIGSGIEYIWKRVSVELQVRTLLQDGWGELTHEDTYKPGTELPPLIKVLARRMANLLSCVDELAQDLRDELDRQGSLRLMELPDQVATTGLIQPISPPQMVAQEPASVSSEEQTSFPEEALIEETKTIVSNLHKPETLANVAFRLQTLFGSHISRQHWGRFGSFKGLLIHAVPDVQIENVGPSWILPPGFTREDVPGGSAVLEDQDNDADVPNIIRVLRQFEVNIPAVSTVEINRYLNSAAAALAEELWRELAIPKDGLGIQHVNLLSKEIRDRVQLSGNNLTRTKLGYVLIALLTSGNLRTGLSVDQVRLILHSFIVARIGHHGIQATEEDVTALEEWLGI
jgi:ppGpp synthetase/RelA/SpoT-type nucleotidyltranferase